MAWKIEFSKTAEKRIVKMDPRIQRDILGYLRDRIAKGNDPRNFGKHLRGDKSVLWRYRVGSYRLICFINDNDSTVVVLDAGHRKKYMTLKTNMQSIYE